MTQRICYWIIISILFSVPLSGQNLADTYALGNELYSMHQYEAALQMYERVVFFDSDRQFAEETYLKMAESHKILSNWKQAQRYYNLAYYTAKTPQTQTDIQFKQISLHLLSGNYLAAREELFALEDQLLQSEIRRYTFYSAITHFVSEEYDSAFAQLQRYIGPENIAAQSVLQDFIKQNKKISRLNPKTARILSLILPGLGQFYAGDLKNGLNSLLLTGGLIVLAVHLSITISPLDGILTAGPWYLRYYQGGVKDAEQIAKDKKQQKRAILYQKLLEFLILQTR